MREIQPPPPMSTVLVLTDKKAEQAFERFADRLLARVEPSPTAPAHPDGFDWLPLKRVQELTGWSKATLARRRADGSLPYALVGQSVFIHVDDLRALMERHRVGASGDGAASAPPEPS